MYGNVDNTQDYISTDDIAERISELEEARDILADSDLSDEDKEGYEFSDEEERELEILLEIQDEYGDADEIISENYFATYAEDFVRGCYEGDFDEFPFNCIDWDEVAVQMLQDYSELSFDGVSYFYR